MSKVWKESSRLNWHTTDGQPGTDQLGVGCLQRMADGIEKLSRNFAGNSLSEYGIQALKVILNERRCRTELGCPKRRLACTDKGIQELRNHGFLSYGVRSDGQYLYSNVALSSECRGEG